MKARRNAQVALLTLAAFAVGLTWARNWPAVIGLAIGGVIMTLTMGLLASVKRDDWMRWHHREMDKEGWKGYRRGRVDEVQNIAYRAEKSREHTAQVERTRHD